MPEYVYCETEWTTCMSRWHIRKQVGRMTALCGRRVAQDIVARLNEYHNRYTCPTCLKAYSQAANATPGDEKGLDLPKPLPDTKTQQRRS
jgi:hypothetical protein